MAKNKRNEFDDLLDQVTSNFNLESDLNLTLQICDLINEGKCSPKHALLSLDKKLRSQNPHVAFLALLVLESLEKNCGGLIHDEVVTKSYMEKLCQLVKTTKHANARKKIIELIQRIDPRLSKKHFLDDRNILFVADKDYECHKCNTPIKLGEEMRNCQTCGNVYCTICSLTFAEFDIGKEAGVCDTCYDKGELKSLELEPENQPNEGRGEEEEDEEMAVALPTACFTCKANFEEEKVHCEACQNLFCGDCASKKTKLPFASEQVTVCDTCYLLHKGPDPHLILSDSEAEGETLIIVVPEKMEESEPEGARALSPTRKPVRIVPVPDPVPRPRLNPALRAVQLSEDEQYQLAVTLSLDDTNNYIPEQEDIDLAIAYSLCEPVENILKLKEPEDESKIDEDAQLALALSSSKLLQQKKYEESLATVFGGAIDKNCHQCKNKLNPVIKNENCESCGNEFCKDCVIKTSSLPKFGIGVEVEVCQICYDLLKVMKRPKPGSEMCKGKNFPPLPVDKNVCHKCGITFNTTSQKDYCRACGNIFCNGCLTLSTPLPVFDIEDKVKVCESCFAFHNQRKTLNALKKMKVLEQENQRLYQENKRLTQSGECKICLDNNAGTVFFPCRHLVACEKCAATFQICPVCRESIQSFVKIFTL